MKLPAALRSWAEQHARVAIGSLGQIRRRPSGSLMTMAVIGVSLALPAVFLLAINNLQNATAGWDGTPRISVFLEQGASAEAQTRLRDQAAGLEDVAAVELITPEAGLQSFEQHSDMGETLALLDENPLPAALEIRLAEGTRSEDAEQLVTSLGGLEGVTETRLDRAWLQRLEAIMALAGRGVALIALLLALTVILVVGNTIRLDIGNRRSEIEITKLIGGTDAFVRRPFLYTGLWYGFAGGLMAALLLIIAVQIIGGPAGHLAELYGSGFQPEGPGLLGTLRLIVIGTALGLLGAWIAVGRHLSQIEPEG